jgi:hypothetical protein
MPFSETSDQILYLCENREIEGFITPVICSNIYYILRRRFEHQKVINQLLKLISFVGVCSIDKAIILKSLLSDFKDFEDALQNYSAEMDGQIGIIITRNIKDYSKSKLVVQTPELFLKSLDL